MKTPQKKIQVNFLATAKNIDSAEQRAHSCKHPQELAMFGDKFAQAWLRNCKKHNKNVQAIKEEAVPTERLLAFPLLLSPNVCGELIEAVINGNVNPSTWGTEILSAGESLLIESYSIRNQMSNGSDLAERPRSRGYLFRDS